MTIKLIFKIMPRDTSSENQNSAGPVSSLSS
jgi:hypothetical protein